MRAMVLARADSRALELVDREEPIVLPGDVLVRVRACGVCRIDVRIVDGEMPVADFPLVPGHEVVGVVEDVGDGVTHVEPGDRVGIPWLGHTCGQCSYCKGGREHLCADARFTGYQSDGGFAEYAVADGHYVVKLPDGYSDTEIAPLLCAGLIGYRAYRAAGDSKRLGIYGDGAAADIAAQLAAHEGREVYGDDAGSKPVDAAIIFAPSGALVPEALARVVAGGTVVCAGLHMSDLPSFAYSHLLGDRVVRSVANATRKDATDFLAIAARVPLKTRVQRYTLGDANRALSDLRDGRVSCAAVLEVDS
jgi:propanol-preferring alcohol dehydrogenase